MIFLKNIIINYCNKKNNSLYLHQFSNILITYYMCFTSKNIKTGKIDYLILGLGNPGKKYEKTRHNIGWLCVERLAQKYSAQFSKISQIANFSKIKICNKNIVVAMPLTYMNLSGLAAKKLCNKFLLSPDKLLVVVDEYNFPIGKLHMKLNSGDGGHNGIASIIYELATNGFYKLRCGIDRNFSQGELVDYVLSEFKNEELDELEKMILNSVLAIEYFVEFGANKAMSEINSGKLFAKDQNNTNLKKDDNPL
jgi:PTH1 family peptidyl-tRNA hydrolase